MPATACEAIIINALGFKNRLNSYCVKCEVSKTTNTNKVRPLNA